MLSERAPALGGQGAHQKGSIYNFLAWGERYPEESWEAPLLLKIDEDDWSTKYLQGSSIWDSGDPGEPRAGTHGAVSGGKEDR